MRIPVASLTGTIVPIMIATSAALTPDQYSTNPAYLTWLETSGNNYETSLFVATVDDATLGMGLFWTIDRNDNKIRLAVVCPSTTGEGFCAMGIAEAGAMLGADMVVFESQNDTLYDAHVLDNPSGGPIRDSCQNWRLLNHVHASGTNEVGGMVLFEAQRSLDTGDTFDRVIIDDSDPMIPPTRIIGAWGDTPTVSYHGTNVVRSSIRFFGSDGVDETASFQRAMQEVAEGSIEIRASDYPVPANETWYAHLCFTYADLIALGLPKDVPLHTIGIEPIVDGDAKEFVHHYIVGASLNPLSNYTSPIPEDTCQVLERWETAYVWAPGEGPFAFPENVGGLLGTNGYKSFNMEIHYNNPSLKTGVLDSSGIRIHWTSKKREYDMGILQLGDPIISLFGQVVGNGVSHHTFECPERCSQISVQEEGVTVIREYLHMHKTGERVYNEQIRNGEVIHKGVVDYWDFDQQGNQAVQQSSFQILPGDSFRTRCYFNSDDEVWGLGSQDEMCMGFLFYYPRQVVADNATGLLFPYMCSAGFELLGGGIDVFKQCSSSYINGSTTLSDLDRTFGGSNGGVCESIDDQAQNNNDNTASSAAVRSGFYTMAIFAGAVLVSMI